MSHMVIVGNICCSLQLSNENVDSFIVELLEQYSYSCCRDNDIYK